MKGNHLSKTSVFSFQWHLKWKWVHFLFRLLEYAFGSKLNPFSEYSTRTKSECKEIAEADFFSVTLTLDISYIPH